MTSLLVLGLMRSRGLDASIGAGGPFVVRPRKHTLAEQMFLVASEDARVLADNNGCRPSGPPGPDPRGQATGARPMHRSVGKVAFIRFQPASYFVAKHSLPDRVAPGPRDQGSTVQVRFVTRYLIWIWQVYTGFQYPALLGPRGIQPGLSPPFTFR